MSGPYAPLGYHSTEEPPGFAASDRQLYRHSEYGSDAHRQAKRRRASSEGCFHKTYAPVRRQEIPRRSSDPTAFTQAHSRTSTNKRLLQPPYNPEETSTFDRLNIFEALSRRQLAQDNSAVDNSMEPIPYKSCDDQPPKKTKAVSKIPKKSSSASSVTADDEICLGKDFNPGNWDVVSQHDRNYRLKYFID